MADLDLKKPGVENQNVPDIVSDGDSLPEYLILAEPLQDAYDSDILKDGKKEKLLNNEAINGSDIKPWELKYFLKFGFESFWGEYTMENIKAQGLLENAFTMFFPQGFPECYYSSCSIAKNDSFKSTISKSFKQFMEQNRNKWLKELFPNNLNNMSEAYITAMKENLEDYVEKHHQEDHFNDAYNLAARVTDVMHYLVKDENGPKIQFEDHDKNEKHELVKGLVYHIMSYLKIPAIYNSEGIYHFQHHNVTNRTLETPVSFKVKPDASVFVNIPSCEMRLPFGVVEVHGPFSKDILEKVRMGSEDDSVLSSPASGSDEKKESAPGKILKEELEDPVKMSDKGDEKKSKVTDAKLEEPMNLPDIPFACKDPKNISEHKSNEMKSLSISKETNDPSDPSKISVSNQIADEFSVQIVDKSDSSDTSVYKSDEKKRNINAQIRAKGPSACKEFSASTKFYGQLPLKMYGMLIKRDQSLNRTDVSKLSHEEPLVGMGMFVWNEYVYLAKIVDTRKNLRNNVYGLKPLSCGPTVTYAKNFWFNLKNPEHLFAFMYFISCYFKIEKAMNWDRQKYFKKCTKVGFSSSKRHVHVHV